MITSSKVQVTAFCIDCRKPCAAGKTTLTPRCLDCYRRFDHSRNYFRQLSERVTKVRPTKKCPNLRVKPKRVHTFEDRRGIQALHCVCTHTLTDHALYFGGGPYGDRLGKCSVPDCGCSRYTSPSVLVSFERESGGQA